MAGWSRGRREKARFAFLLFVFMVALGLTMMMAIDGVDLWRGAIISGAWLVSVAVAWKLGTLVEGG